MEALDFVTGNTLTNLGLYKSGSAGTGWRITGRALLRAIVRSATFGLSLAPHTTLPTTTLDYIVQRIAPYTLRSGN